MKILIQTSSMVSTFL